MNRKLIDLTLLERFKKMFDKKLEVLNTEVDERFGEVNANLEQVFQSGSNAKQMIVDACVAAGAKVSIQDLWEIIAESIKSEMIVVKSSGIILYGKDAIVKWNGKSSSGHTDAFDVTKINRIIVSVTARAGGYSNGSNIRLVDGGRAVINIKSDNYNKTQTFEKWDIIGAQTTYSGTLTFDTKNATGNCIITMTSYYRQSSDYHYGEPKPADDTGWVSGYQSSGSQCGGTITGAKGYV